jgi:hypothetical protein
MTHCAWRQPAYAADTSCAKRQKRKWPPHADPDRVLDIRASQPVIFVMSDNAASGSSANSSDLDEAEWSACGASLWPFSGAWNSV